MGKWVFYALVFVYMCYRAVYGARVLNTSISVEPLHYDDDGYLEVGTRKTITCKAANKNQRLEWEDPFGNVVKRIPSSRVFAQEHFVSNPKGGKSPGLVLTFSELMVSDSGVYQCKSSGQTQSVRVCVIKPSEFVDSIDTPTDVTVEAGRSITLVCQGNGDPEPRIVWSRNMKELVEGVDYPKYKVNRRFKPQGYESHLTIFSVEPEDAGMYHCMAVQESAMLDDCIAIGVRNITLQVNYEPIFKHGKDMENVYGRNNEVVNIKCAAKGWPKPTYRWFKDLGGGSLYEFDKSKIVFSEEFNTAVLPVTATPTTYGNIYKCTASNVFGDIDKYFKLLRREKPWKADHVNPTIITSNSVSLNVTWDDTIYFPVDSFSIQYISSSEVSSGSSSPSRSDWEEAEEVVKAIDEDEEDDDESSGSGYLVKLNKLEPETEYFIRLRAENAAGEAPWSDSIQLSTTGIAESETEDKTEEPEESKEKPTTAATMNSDTGMFYGIFFTGGIIIVAVVCMFAMRLV